VGGASFFTSPLILEFGMGALAAFAARKTALPFGRTALVLAAAGFVGGAVWTAWWVQNFGALLPDLQRLACFGLGSFFLVYGLASVERNHGFVLGGIWQVGGAISYAVYLLHSPILKTARALLPEHGLAGWGAIASILGLAWLAHIVIERPSIAAARRLRRPLSEH
jgi:peptidoglycan/LPS O-acetylase OafA/YrhL